MNSRNSFLKLFCMLLITITTFSCSKDDGNSSDDPNGPINTELIEGQWRLTKEVDYFAGMTDTFNVECNTESRLIITDTEMTSKADYDCDGNYDEETTISYSIGSYLEFDSVIMYQGNPAAIILTLTNTNLVFTDDYYVDPDTGEEEYTAYFYVRN